MPYSSSVNRKCRECNNTPTIRMFEHNKSIKLSKMMDNEKILQWNEDGLNEHGKLTNKQTKHRKQGECMADYNKRSNRWTKQTTRQTK